MTGEVPVIELRGVARSYSGPPVVEALRPHDLRVAHGEYVAMTGPSGSGKSTWLNVVGLLDRPTSGEYLVNGIPTTSLPDIRRTALRAAHIGFVFQSFHVLPNRTAVENVMLGGLYQGKRRSDRRATALATLDRVGLSGRADAAGGVLSGGELQRVAVARALVSDPSLLLCDEPTGNLDGESSARIVELLEEVNRDGQTVVVITHDRDLAARARRTIRVRDGMVTS
ncbi:Methionine ABC transporter ATP-binding protein [Alloactinosynnema sp. L-07]|uniref:ABC transporter ATP-binding protein n=1 Tax=Alloactinosynnema sp. L-07 TaxID=1653480 RepID=UPI00065EFBAE|nr:ABC transporter ATP-binding protein [Alloactinosynnema sp. L-07]CRK60643.1 Methionine ABC transporter ATP-binding protein [Alloactinosynnema sp. L-07]